MSKSLLKLARSLRKKKYRKEVNYFLVEGAKMIDEARRVEKESRNKIIEHLFIADSFEGDRPPESIEISDREMSTISSLATPPGILAICRMKHHKIDEVSDIIFLDRMRDPGNLGTLLRLADWFGDSALALSEGCVDPYNPKVVQSTMGAIFRVPFSFVDSSFINQKKSEGFAIMAAHMEGDSVAEKVHWSPKNILIAGNESHGLSNDLLTLADEKILIPGKGQAESLNVTLATSIIWSQMKFRK